MSLLVPIVLFALTALGGTTMAVMRLRGHTRPPFPIAVGHGVLALASLATLAMAMTTAPVQGLTRAALFVFIGAALGGLTLFLGFHLRGRPLPVPIVLVHGAVAVTGFILLVLGAGLLG